MRNLAISLLGIASVLGSSGCERQPSIEQASTPASATTAEPTIVPEATDSGLALKRGILALSEERALFKPCGSAEQWWVLDQSPQLQTQALMEQAQSSPVEFYIEAYGERASAAEEPQARGFEHLFVLEEILYAGVLGEVRGCDAPDATYIVSARGNEPFWLAEVSAQQVLWRRPEPPKEIVFGAPQTQNAEGGVRYAASHADHHLELIVHLQPCRDTMSGEFFAYSAKAVFDGKEFSGCARVGK